MDAQLTPGRSCLSIASLWGSSPADVWAAGGFGGIFRYGGSRWSAVESECQGGKNYDFHQVHGSAPGDVWIAGGDDSGRGVVYHFDGASWTNVPLPSTVLSLGGVFAAGPGDVWAVGAADRVHWDGTRWTPFPIASDTDASSPAIALHALWGATSNDIWAAGSGGFAAHWNGTSWIATQVATNFPYDFDAVWGTGVGDVWMSGTSTSDGVGALMHYDGRTWTRALGGSLTAVSGVWGSSSSDLWTRGCDASGCVLWHYDGASWTSIFPHRASNPFAFFGVAGQGHVWGAGGETIVHRVP